MIADAIAHWARTSPQRPALIHNGAPISYGAFAHAIALARRALAAEQAPDGVAVVLADDPRDAWTLVLGLRMLGRDTVCVASADHIAPLQLRHPGCIVVPGSVSRAAADAAARALPVIAVPLAACFDAGPADAPQPWSYPHGCGGHILHTSGTTGSRKKLLLTDAIEDKANAERARQNSLSGDTLHHSLDFGLWTGIGFRQTSAVWHVGGCVIVDRRPGLFARFFENGTNRAALLPAHLKDLLNAAAPTRAATPGVELRIGGGHLPLEIAQDAARRLSRHLIVSYGSTELSTSPAQSHFKAAEDLDWLTPVGGRLVQIVDDEGRPCPPGMQGAVRFPLNELDFRRYFEDEDASAGAFRDGCFYPGDIAVARDDGRLRLLGRSQDVIEIGGEKMAVAPLEETIRAALRVEEVCLFTNPVDSGGQELVMAIQTTRELPAHALAEIAREFGLFARVRAATFAAFPRTDTGTRKTKRAALRDRALAAAQLVDG